MYGQDSEYTRLTSLNERYKDSSASERDEWLVKGNLPLHSFQAFFTKLRRTLFASRTFSVSPIFIFCLHRKDSVLFFPFVWTECNSDRLTYISKKKKKMGVWSVRPLILFRQGFQKLYFFPSIFCLFKVFLLVFFLYNTYISLKLSE